MAREKQTLTVLLPREVHRQLKKLAAENCYSLSGYVRQILKEHLRRLEADSEGRRGQAPALPKIPKLG